MIACLEMAKEISIHTPTKGVTFSSVFKNLITFISIHTPTKGVTEKKTEDAGEIQDFNPHSHEGSDNQTKLKLKLTHSISIHTPTKGVTLIASFV